MIDQRPVIVGMNNTYSRDPRHALYPAPAGCAGHRLWRMLHEETGASRLEYIESFERVNLVVGEWSRDAARAAATEILARSAGRTLLLLGREVQRAFDAPPDLNPMDCFWRSVRLVPRMQACLYAVPHPSGRNLWYNDESNRRMVAFLLGRLYRAATESREVEMYSRRIRDQATDSVGEIEQ